MREADRDTVRVLTARLEDNMRLRHRWLLENRSPHSQEMRELERKIRSIALDLRELGETVTPVPGEPAYNAQNWSSMWLNG
jgi:hypothetical protein